MAPPPPAAATGLKNAFYSKDWWECTVKICDDLKDEVRTVKAPLCNCTPDTYFVNPTRRNFDHIFGFTITKLGHFCNFRFIQTIPILLIRVRLY